MDVLDPTTLDDLRLLRSYAARGDVAAFPDDLRAVVTEHFLCGRTQTELAASLGVNQSTVHRKIEKGLHQLRESLKDESPAALAALPMLLGEFSRASAPQALREALTK